MADMSGPLQVVDPSISKNTLVHHADILLLRSGNVRSHITLNFPGPIPRDAIRQLP